MPIIEQHVPTIQESITKAEESMHHSVHGSLAIYSTISSINKILDSRTSLDSGNVITQIEDNDDDLREALNVLIEAEAAARFAQKNITIAIEKLKAYK